MGKKRIITESGHEVVAPKSEPGALARKRHLPSGRLYIQATYNNTKLTLTDGSGNAFLSASSGSLGFKGTKKGTPFAASKVAELVADRAKNLGLQEVNVIIRGVGSGRESAVRAFAARGFTINSIRDATPVPFNGPKPPRARRV